MKIRRFDVTENRVCEYEVYGDMVQDSSGAYVIFEDYYASHAYDEDKEHALFEAQFPLDPGVEWRPEAGRAGAYCVFIDREGGFWSPCNSAFHAQQKWETWKVCAMSRALKVLP